MQIKTYDLTKKEPTEPKHQTNQFGMNLSESHVRSMHITADQGQLRRLNLPLRLEIKTCRPNENFAHESKLMHPILA